MLGKVPRWEMVHLMNLGLAHIPCSSRPGPCTKGRIPGSKLRVHAHLLVRSIHMDFGIHQSRRDGVRFPWLAYRKLAYKAFRAG
jgi:hypothetical protein